MSSSSSEDSDNDRWRRELNEEQSKRLELQRKIESLVARRAVLKAALVEEQQTTDDLNARLNVLVAQFRALQKTTTMPMSPSGARKSVVIPPAATAAAAAAVSNTSVNLTTPGYVTAASANFFNALPPNYVATSPTITIEPLIITPLSNTIATTVSTTAAPSAPLRKSQEQRVI